jgi:hypothetical protein
MGFRDVEQEVTARATPKNQTAKRVNFMVQNLMGNPHPFQPFISGMATLAQKPPLIGSRRGSLRFPPFNASS